MAIPPRGDPRRPLHLAVRSTRVLAIIFLLFGTCASIPMLIQGALPMRGRMFLNLGVFIVYVGPGVVYFVTAIYMKRRQFWAVILALVMASIQLLFALLGISVLLIAEMRRPASSVAMIPAGVMIFVILALAQLIYHLALSFNAIRYTPVEEQHGFEPLMAQAVESPTAPKEDEAKK
jgi:hypothetical protein